MGKEAKIEHASSMYLPPLSMSTTSICVIVVSGTAHENGT